VDAQHTTLLIVAVAVVCAGLGLWLGTALADDTGSIILIAAGCGVLGSFAPGTIRWLAGGAARRDRPPRPPR
jgi:hypothetical protein